MPDMMEFLDGLQSDGDIRRGLLRQFAASVRAAAGAGPASWSVLARESSRLLRLNVGRLFLFDIRRGRVDIVVEVASLGEAGAAAAAGAPERQAGLFRSAPRLEVLTFEPAQYLAVADALRPAHDAAIRVAAAAVRRVPVYRAHSPEAVEAIARESGIALSQPVYEPHITPPLVERVVGLVRRRYPDWTGFEDTRFVKEEREYKQAAVRLLRELLSEAEMRRLAAAGADREIAARVDRVAHATNLLYVSTPRTGDLFLLHDPSVPAAQLSSALIDLLYGPGDGPERLDRFARWSEAAAGRSAYALPTYLLMLADPEREFFVKPEATARFVELLGRPMIFRGAPSSERYGELLDLMGELSAALDAFRPKDMIDLQSLLWVVAKEAGSAPQAGAGNGTGAGEEAEAVGPAGAGRSTRPNLRDPDALRQCHRDFEAWWPTQDEWRRWHANLDSFLRWVASATEEQRATREFHKRLWDENPVAAPGQGNLSVDGLIADEGFRSWFARESTRALPDDPHARAAALRTFAGMMEERLASACTRVPRLKMYRVLAALHPTLFSTVADVVKMSMIHRALLNERADGVDMHLEVMRRLDEVLGPVDESYPAIIVRMSFPWYVYDQVLVAPGNVSAADPVRRADASRVSPAWSPPAPPMGPEDEDQVESGAEMPASFGGRIPSAAAVVQNLPAGLHFDASLVPSLHAGLWADGRRHFAVLTGLSGSGKTRLAIEYARAFASAAGYAPPERRHMLLVAVQPGWTDPSSLLGYVNPLRPEAYVRTPALDFLLRAAAHPDQAHFLVLDEMNLSHPEQYLAPLLSSMETGLPIELHREPGCIDVPQQLPYPVNLVVFGTVNMDETTHGLSDKILDRAHTVEFWDIDLEQYPGRGRRTLTSADEDAILGVLMDLMAALAPARLHFGWRVVDEVFDFVARATADSGMLLPDALDRIVHAKVLPKLRGDDSLRLREALEATEKRLREAGLERSAARVHDLHEDLVTTGTARFWR